MSTLTIETKDQATTEKVLWLLNSLRSEGVRIISKENDLSTSKNVPNAETVEAMEDTDYETVSIDDLKGLCR